MSTTNNEKNGIDVHIQESVQKRERPHSSPYYHQKLFFFRSILTRHTRYMRLSWEILSCHLGELLTVINRYPQCAEGSFPLRGEGPGFLHLHSIGVEVRIFPQEFSVATYTYREEIVRDLIWFWQEKGQLTQFLNVKNMIKWFILFTLKLYFITT